MRRINNTETIGVTHSLQDRIVSIDVSQFELETTVTECVYHSVQDKIMTDSVILSVQEKIMTDHTIFSIQDTPRSTVIHSVPETIETICHSLCRKATSRLTASHFLFKERAQICL